MKNKKGFTLIELLIVIAIITILAAALVVTINPARHFQAARNATRWNQMNSIATAIYSYTVEHAGTFPEPDCIGTSTTPIEITEDWCPVLIPDYLHALPVPPQASSPVNEVYRIEFDGTAIKITSSAAEASSTVLIQ